ncbi:MAG: alpha/beta hydrolase [bacterium]|nr:alpha/beta hydrolase [bacterium]
MPNVEANGICIEYETMGAPDARPLVMLMGLGSQLVAWETEFCRQIAEHGHFVILPDNRDVGLSTKFESAGPLNALQTQADLVAGKPVELPYTLDDMADDTIALLDALEIDRAHVMGVSMGGMIAQTAALRHPKRVSSLISIMSTTGNPEVPPATPEAMAVLLEDPPGEREANIEAALRTWKVIGSPGFPFDEARIRGRAERSFDRCFHPDGSSRQLAAVLAHGNRKPALAGLATPTLVVHGTQDSLVPVEGGRDTADAIPGSELLLIEGMGHDLPREAWPRLVAAISTHTGKSEASTR